MIVSFSVVTYNNEKSIETTVRSLLESIPTEYDYCLYIIDNGSSDDTLNIVEKIAGNIEVIKTNNNAGFGYGHNMVLGNLKSKYHFIVNPDIKIEEKETLSNAIEFLENNVDIGLLVPKVLNEDGTIQYLNKRNPTIFDMGIRFISPNIFKKRQDKYVMKDYDYNTYFDVEYATGCFMIFRTKIYEELKGFDEDFFMYLEDADITRRTRSISKVIYNPNIKITHYWERASHKKLKYIIITFESMRTYFRKWGWKFI